MEMIYTYALKEPLKTTNGGNCKWGLAEKGKKTYFIKELLSPVYPLDDCGLSAKAIEKKRKYCETFEQRQSLVYKQLNQHSNGALQKIEEFFRYGSRYYVVTQQIEALPPSIITDRSFTQEDRERVCLVLMHALAGMHEAGLIHGDIKLDNILFYKTAQGFVSAKIIDFEDAFMKNESPEPGEEIRGDQIYLSPEAFRLMTGEPLKLTQAIDVYALGLAMYQILSGSTQIMKGQAHTYPFEELLGGGELALGWNGISNKFADCIRKMILSIPENRPALSDTLHELQGDIPEELPPVPPKPPKEEHVKPGDTPGGSRGRSERYHVGGQTLISSMGKRTSGKKEEPKTEEKSFFKKAEDL